MPVFASRAANIWCASDTFSTAEKRAQALCARSVPASLVCHLLTKVSAASLPTKIVPIAPAHLSSDLCIFLAVTDSTSCDACSARSLAPRLFRSSECAPPNALSISTIRASAAMSGRCGVATTRGGGGGGGGSLAAVSQRPSSLRSSKTSDSSESMSTSDSANTPSCLFRSAMPLSRTAAVASCSAHCMCCGSTFSKSFLLHWQCLVHLPQPPSTTKHATFCLHVGPPRERPRQRWWWAAGRPAII